MSACLNQTVVNQGKKRTINKFAAIVLGIVLGLALAEGVAHIWLKVMVYPQESADASDLRVLRSNAGRWQEHPYTNYMPRPGYTLKMGGSLVSQHNSLGFRGGEFAREKPAGTFRIAMIGGSAVYSSRIMRDWQSIPSQLQSILKHKGYRRIEVINAGVSGQSTAEALSHLQFRILELSPDLVIVYEAINDLHNRYVPHELFHADNRGRQKRWETFDWPIWARTSLGIIVGKAFGLFEKNYFIDYHIAAATYLGHTATAEVTAGVDYEKLLRENTPVFFRENLLSIYSICHIRGIKVLFTSYGYSLAHADTGYLKSKNYLHGLLEMNDAARQLAREYSIPFFDYEAVMPKDGHYWRDEIHVSPTGAAMTGRLFANYLIENGLVPR